MALIDGINTKASTNQNETALERENRLLARKAATESIVLLENDGTLPLEAGCKVALFGEGAVITAKGGSGSGEVNVRHTSSLLEGMLQSGITVTNRSFLENYMKQNEENHKTYLQKKRKEAGFANFSVTMANMQEPYWPLTFPKLNPQDLNTDADTCVYVLFRLSGESYDRRLEPGDFELTELETENIRTCAEHFRKTILVINTGGMINLASIDDCTLAAVVFAGMPGCDGGCALADVLTGAHNPSGHLTDTWPVNYEDIPFASEYSALDGKPLEGNYRDGIYVGYRYFHTFGIKPRYAFGHGLSYTSFAHSSKASMQGRQMQVDISVTNTGSLPGKDVVQVYVSCPQGSLQKESIRLAGFTKTNTLDTAQTQNVAVCFDWEVCASYDESRNAYILEAGEYLIWEGRALDQLQPIAKAHLVREVILSLHEPITAPALPFRELEQAHLKNQEFKVPSLDISADCFATVRHTYREPEASGDADMLQILGSLTQNEIAHLVVGGGNDMLMPKKHTLTVPGTVGYSTDKLRHKGITDIPFSDGPAGLRLQTVSVTYRKKGIVKAITASLEMFYILPGVLRMLCFGKPENGTLLYQYPTAFPAGTNLAQTWNTELLEEVGYGISREMESLGVTVWLGPGLNIHRNPLCGRNYEYYSEDPLLSGKMAAAIVRGIQRIDGHVVSMKHFFCNNQETERQMTNAVVSQRAMREIYLKGFEIAVKEGHANGIMTSYNKINGAYSAVFYDVLTKIVRNEWGFQGLIITDWDDTKEGNDAGDSIAAGLDLLMPGSAKQYKQILRALKDGRLKPAVLKTHAARVLAVIMKSQAWKYR